ncbi:DUF960 domain-containing protein [Lactiplantibacillus nangangensis]|uniref:DUF960 domain-containing protein n=1 Tax=Lactiplantibacillus nangangensis TaxID=2559917 RepID=A0ABW1SJE5_9LACO|nr:DUF960 domain-containing protein [Lactiplantibacillus nangangensis]
MFNQNAERYATFGLVAKLPSEVIDGIWGVIDEDLRGVVKLPRVLQFALIARHGQVTVVFDDHQDSIFEFDLPFDYQRSFPETVAVLDDGQNQTMMLLAELNA